MDSKKHFFKNLEGDSPNAFRSSCLRSEIKNGKGVTTIKDNFSLVITQLRVKYNSLALALTIDKFRVCFCKVKHRKERIVGKEWGTTILVQGVKSSI
jgi:hypothetical protein